MAREREREKEIVNGETFNLLNAVAPTTTTTCIFVFSQQAASIALRFPSLVVDLFSSFEWRLS